MKGAKSRESARRIKGRHALSVGPCEMHTPKGWRWVRLTEVARLESGHTPSRSHAEYWDGDVAWVGIRDARLHHGGTINDTSQHVTALGIENSSARILPAGTVCLSRTASVGYVVVMGRPMATSQDFVNWVCGPDLEPRFLQWILVAEGDGLRSFGEGSTHTTIYFPEVLAFQVCLPPLDVQRRIVAKLDALLAQSRAAREQLEAVPALVETYRQSVLAAAFRGDLTADWRKQHADTEPIERVLNRVVGTLPPPRMANKASKRLIEGRAALSVGPVKVTTPKTWKQTRLTDVARLESGHTPSRAHPEYWDQGIPWIGIRDAGANHGRLINSTLQTVSSLGLANSAARLLPPGTVCLSRTASVGYATVMGISMATSQDFVNWVCSEAIVPKFLMYLFIAEGDHLLKFGEGSTHTTIYFPEVLAFHVVLPPVAEQNEIVRRVEAAIARVNGTETLCRSATVEASTLANSLLTKAFKGNLA